MMIRLSVPDMSNFPVVNAVCLTTHTFPKPHLHFHHRHLHYNNSINRSLCPAIVPISKAFRSSSSIHASSSSSSSFATTATNSNNTEGGNNLDCVVVGAGISGLCTAQSLLNNSNVNLNLVVTEASDRVGGNISTVERDGYLWEEGPNSFQPSDSMLSLALRNGLLDELVLADPTAPRFVLWDSKLKPLPSKPSDLPFFDLISFTGKLRAAFGALGFRPPSSSTPRSNTRFNQQDKEEEESIEQFVRRNLGDEVFERLIEPFCSGVYAGDPSQLSMKAAFGKVWQLEQKGGSIIAGAVKTLLEKRSNPSNQPPPRDPRLPKPKGQTVGSFKKGLAVLPNAIATRLGDRVKLNWKLSSISKLSGGDYSLTYETPEGIVTLQTKSVVMTIPSYIASSLLLPLSEAAADALSKFYYPPVAVVSISYPKEAIRRDCLIDGELKGFGQLHPRSQGIETLGTIYTSSLFPNRAPDGRVLLLNFIGGATNPGILSKTEGELVEAVDRDLRKMLLNPSANDPLVLGVRVWPKAIPQFLIGHFDQLGSAKASLKNSGLHGVFLGGNYVSGVALGRCVDFADEVAAEVANYLSRYAHK